MPAPETVDVVLAGGATHVVTLAAAVGELSRRVRIARVGGSSAGAIAAAATAFGLSEATQKAALTKLLSDNFLLDRAWWPLDTYGLHNGEKLHSALRTLFGDAQMDDSPLPLRIVVCDLYTRRPVVIDSTDAKHGQLRVADVLRCSIAIPVFFKAWTLPEVWGNRLFVDGGVAANFAMEMFDDNPRPTVGVRLSPPKEDDVVPVRSLAAYAMAVAACLLWSSDNAHVSAKNSARTVCVPQIGSGLDFSLTPELFAQRWQAGVLAVTDAKGMAPRWR